MFRFAKPLYPSLFSLVKGDPEKAHKQLLETLNWLEKSKNTAIGRRIEQQIQDSFTYRDDRLKQTLWGLNFANPLGLAAGFDKDGQGAGIWADFGFGFAELGAVTLKAQIGNPRPRLFRLPHDRAVLNRMGANNLGAAVMAKTLQSAWQKQPRQIPIGINLCKSKVTPLEEAAADYLGSFKLLRDRADYFVVNVSSPNTPGLRSLQAGEQLEPILSTLQQENQQKQPILIKISPDLELDAIADILNLAKTYQLAGVIATNTTTTRAGLNTKILQATGKDIQEEAGGISGLPIKQRSTEIIRFIWQQTRGELPIIGVGGIFTVEDAWEKIIAGASLLQIYTGWVYEGPWMVRGILEGLGQKLANKGISRLSEAVGSENDCQDTNFKL
ncbi:MAG: quinone-dependent dihydroorotate dehydrogenase [Prochloraceae cyanobacterium]|nr:quinone-dependent dihydroorotate dehydrogenase [Prochloraceae cyanobacterium]